MAHRRYFEPGVGWVEDIDGPFYDETEMVGPANKGDELPRLPHDVANQSEWGERNAMYGKNPHMSGKPPRREPSYDELMDQFKEAGCEHEFVEAVDDDGNLIEPPFDICIQCGAVRH